MRHLTDTPSKAADNLFAKHGNILRHKMPTLSTVTPSRSVRVTGIWTLPQRTKQCRRCQSARPSSMFNPFSRKKAVPLDEFCFHYLDKQIVNPVISGVDAGKTYTEVIHKQIGREDPSFLSVGIVPLHAQFLVVRVEIFALAWVHEFGFDLAGPASAFIRDYLGIVHRASLWEDGEPYNQAAARSALIHGTTTERGRQFSQALDVKRLKLFEKFVNSGVEAKAAARVANRVGTDAGWKAGLTPGYLMLTLCEKLGFSPNEKVQELLVYILRGFYDGVRNEMREVKILPESERK